MIFEFIVRGDKIEEKKEYKFIEGNRGSYEAVFEFGEEWDELAKVCVVEQGENTYFVDVISGNCLLPELVKGAARIGVVGTDSLDGAALSTRTSTNMLTIGVQDGAANKKATAQLNTAAEIWERYLSQMENSRRAAEEAAVSAEKSADTAGKVANHAQLSADAVAGYAQTAESSKSAASLSAESAKKYADSAELSADDARKSAESITEMTVGVSTSEPEYDAEVVKTVKEKGIHLQFALPRGAKGDKGDAGADGHTPVKGKDYFTNAEKEELLSTPRTIYQFTNGVRLEAREDGVWAVTANDEIGFVESQLVNSDGDIVGYYAEEANYAYYSEEAERAMVAEEDNNGRQLKGTEIIDRGDVTNVDISITDGVSRYYGIVSNSIIATIEEELIVGFESELYFTTPSAIPNNYSQFPENINFKGDSVGDTFVPEPDTRYTIVFSFDGYMLNGYVSGVSAPPVSSEVTDNE